MNAENTREYCLKVTGQLKEIAERDKTASPNFWSVLATASFVALNEVAAQLSELKTVIRNANLRHEQKDI